MTEFMIRVPRADAQNGVEPTEYLTFTAPGQEQAFDQASWVQRLVASFPSVTNESGVSVRQGDVLLLVHGFNTSEDDAQRWHLQCVAGLAQAGWKGKVVSFRWPSRNLVFAYVDDRFSARAAASALVASGIAVLQANQEQNCTVNVHVLAHSMGAFVVQQAFTWAYQDVPPDWRVAQILFAAGDVDRSVFSQSHATAKAFERHGARLTSYCNRFDKALAVSNAKRLELAPRLGRSGLPDDAPSMMCQVDATDLFDTRYPEISELDPAKTHGFYFSQPEFWRDVVLTLGGGIDRSAFPTRKPDTVRAVLNRYLLKWSDALGMALAPESLHKALNQAKTTPSIDPDSSS